MIPSSSLAELLRSSMAFAGLLAVAATLTACPIGDPNNNLGGKPDARPDARPLCEEPVQTVGSGYHYPGKNCIACHDDNPSDAAPRFSVAGTLYKGKSGLAPLPNATIVIVDAANQQFKLPTQQNGNFFTSAQMEFPVQVKASSCPKENRMMATAVGNCNASGCHDVDGNRAFLQLP